MHSTERAHLTRLAPEYASIRMATTRATVGLLTVAAIAAVGAHDAPFEAGSNAVATARSAALVSSSAVARQEAFAAHHERFTLLARNDTR